MVEKQGQHLAIFIFGSFFTALSYPISAVVMTVHSKEPA